MCKKSQHSISGIAAMGTQHLQTGSGAAGVVLSLQHIPGAWAAAPRPWGPADTADSATLCLPRAVSAAAVYSETQNNMHRRKTLEEVRFPQQSCYRHMTQRFPCKYLPRNNPLPCRWMKEDCREKREKRKG